MTASSTHSPYRTRPSFGSLLFGSIGLWGGSSAVISGTTTIDAALSMTLALLAAGLGVLIVIVFSSLRSTHKDSTPSVTTSELQAENVFEFAEEPIPATPIPATQMPFSAGDQTGPDGISELIEDSPASVDEVHSTEDALSTVEPDWVQTSAEQPTTEEDSPQPSTNPWESDQGWSGDVRW